MPKTIGIVGSRRRDSAADFNLVTKAFLKIYSPGDQICSGHCPKGADKFAEEIAAISNVPIKVFKPRFHVHGSPKAFFARNTLIARASDVLIACVSEDRTGGTEDTIRKFVKLGKGDNLILV